MAHPGGHTAYFIVRVHAHVFKLTNEEEGGHSIQVWLRRLP